MTDFLNLLWPIGVPLVMGFFSAVVAHKSFVESIDEEGNRLGEDAVEFSEKLSGEKTRNSGFSRTLQMTMPAAFTSHALWGIGSLVTLQSADVNPFIMLYVMLLVWGFSLMVMAMKRFPRMNLILWLSCAAFAAARCLLFWGAPGI